MDTAGAIAGQAGASKKGPARPLPALLAAACEHVDDRLLHPVVRQQEESRSRHAIGAPSADIARLLSLTQRQTGR